MTTERKRLIIAHFFALVGLPHVLRNTAIVDVFSPTKLMNTKKRYSYHSKLVGENTKKGTNNWRIFVIQNKGFVVARGYLITGISESSLQNLKQNTKSICGTLTHYYQHCLLH